MQIDERSVGNVKVLDVTGQITMGQGNTQFKDKIHSMVNQGHKQILVNLGGVSYVDSAGLGELVAAFTTVSQRRKDEAREHDQEDERSARHHEAEQRIRNLRQGAGRGQELQLTRAIPDVIWF